MTRVRGKAAHPNTILGRGHSRSRNWSLLALVVFFSAWLAAAICLKLTSANAGAYALDIYDFHTALRSTVEGELFRSYLWGSVMGDHGYLILLLLIPAYSIAPSASSWILVMVTPVVFAVCAALIMLILAHSRYPWWGAVSIASVAMPGLSQLAREPILGFHPDTLAGPLLALAAVGIGLRKGRSRDFGDWFGLGGFILFVLLKEEMAMLGLVFAAPFVVRRSTRRIGVLLGGIAGVATVASFSLLTVMVTPFHRGNSVLVEGLVDQPFLRDGNGIEEILGPVLALSIGAGILVITVMYRRRIATIAVSVALVVAPMTVFLADIVDSLPFFSWHLSLPLFALWYLLLRLAPQLSKIPIRQATAVVGFADVVLVAGIVHVDVGWYSGYSEELADRRILVERSVVAAEFFAADVDNRVVSVEMFEIHAWRDARVTVLPIGLMTSPTGGMSDALVATSGDLEERYGAFGTCFVVQRTAAERDLYIRVSGCPLEDDPVSFNGSSR